MNSITIYVDPATEARLRQIADETGRPLEDLAEAAVSEEALGYFRHRADDPAAKVETAQLARAHRALQAAL